METPLLVHCHMPKTAGSALNRQVFLPRFPRDRTWLAYGVAVERLRRAEADTAPPGAAFISGHVPFGFAEALGRPVIHVSVLRDPVDRVVSFLNFVAVAERHGARRKFREDMPALARKDPSRFAEMILGQDHVRIRQSNTMVRLASGMPRLGRRRPGLWRLGVALQRLASPDYIVGTQRRFDEFAGFLTAFLNEKGIGANISAPPAPDDDADKRFEKVIRRDDLSSATLSLIRDINALDVKFYEAAETAEARRNFQRKAA